MPPSSLKLKDPSCRKYSRKLLRSDLTPCCSRHAIIPPSAQIANTMAASSLMLRMSWGEMVSSAGEAIFTPGGESDTPKSVRWTHMHSCSGSSTHCGPMKACFSLFHQHPASLAGLINSHRPPYQGP